MSSRRNAAVAASVADQGVAALTNIAVVVCAARQSTAGDFASFAVVYTVFALLLGFTGAYVGQALVLRQGSEPELHRHCVASGAFTAYASTLLGAALTAVTFAIPGGIPEGLAALGLVLPIVLTQDTARYAFAVLRRPHLALAADSLRCAVAIPVLALQPYGTGPGRMVLAWGLSAIPAVLLSVLLLARLTRGAARGARARWLLDSGHLGRRFAVEFGVGNAASQLAIVGLGVFGNHLAVGALRGATTLFGPMNVLFNAATGFGPPLLSRIRTPHRQARAAGLAGGGLAALAALTATALALLPTGLGRELLGDTWESAARLLPATGSQYAAMALGTCGLLLLRVLVPRATLPIQVVFSAVSVASLMVGYMVGGIPGAAWGLCVGSAAKAGAVWLRVGLELRTVVRH
ncbi:hypothetical protein [Streptomyces sp. NBC_01803]|uniref:hypothetical protein n=1 Tax=Streptomyces sp. NBC_01803 TaxID=2975946 RepID=UPI002DD85C47|nr:hypothetical protein [Streptomyces sp. NBC_01803]WSA46511.1 hypothetical protein OIE51_21395 [Streptomyces sp. NBC_01803]